MGKLNNPDKMSPTLYLSLEELEYEGDPLFKDNKPTLHVVPCTESEADIYMPFCHKEYREKERRARECFHVYERPWYGIKYWEDPDFPFDWMEGEFC